MTQETLLHASAAAFNDRVVIIQGQSGSGKSQLLIQLMAMGLDYVGDDQLIVETKENGVWVSAHPNANGRFECRGVGIMAASTIAQGWLDLVVNLDQEPKGRLPDQQFVNLCGKNLREIPAKGLINVADIVYLLLKNQISFCDLE